MNQRATLKRISKAERDGAFGNSDALVVLPRCEPIDPDDKILLRDRETNEIELAVLGADEKLQIFGSTAIPLVVQPWRANLIFTKHANWENHAWMEFQRKTCTCVCSCRSALSTETTAIKPAESGGKSGLT
jgi:hypothetical protein